MWNVIFFLTESDVDEPMSPGGTATAQSPPPLLASPQDAIWADIPAEARNILKNMLPHSMMQRFRDLLHRPVANKEKYVLLFNFSTLFYW